MNALKIGCCIGLLFVSFGSIADNKTGIDLYESGMYSASKAYFLKKLNTLPQEEKAEAYYYLGEDYLMLGRPDSAQFYYKKGIEVAPEYPYNHIGMGKLMLKDHEKEVDVAYKDILSIKENRRDIKIRLAIAEAYIYAGNMIKAEEYIDQAKQMDPKSGLPFIVEGDMLLRQGHLGQAASKYDMALYFSPDLLGAYLKAARIYMTINHTVSSEKLLKAQQIAPDFSGIYSILGELHEIKGDSKNAADNYTRFINAGNYDVEHLLRYAGILYFDKQYDKILPIIKPVLAAQPDNVVAKRLNAYVSSKLEPGLASLDIVKNFIETTPEKEIIYQDYICYADELALSKQYAEASIYYKKAFQKDGTKKNLLLEIAEMYAKTPQLDSAARYYDLYLAQVGPDPSVFLKQGRNYYNMASLDSIPETKNMLFHKADSMFTKLTEVAPNSYVGYFWRARTNSALDPETTQGLAKPFYEKVVEITLKQPERFRRELIESYKYLGYYYYVKADTITTKNNGNPDKAKEEYNIAKDYFSKILAIDPNDEVAAKALKDINIK